MCGRYFLEILPELLVEQFHAGTPPSFAASYNLAPTQLAPILRWQDQQPSWALTRWGLVPRWAKALSIGSKMINARAESVAEKPSFRSALQQRRCVIPARGFYEWQLVTGGKRPLAIVPVDLPYFGFAGLWESWAGEDGQRVETHTILTTAANELMQQVHDRMPVILDPSLYLDWIKPGPPDRVDFKASFDAARMRAYPVSPAVGNVRNQGPDLITEWDVGR